MIEFVCCLHRFDMKMNKKPRAVSSDVLLLYTCKCLQKVTTDQSVTTVFVYSNVILLFNILKNLFLIFLQSEFKFSLIFTFYPECNSVICVFLQDYSA